MSYKISSLHWCDKSSWKLSLVSIHIPSRLWFFCSYCRSVSSLFYVKKVLIEMFVHWPFYVCYVHIQKHDMFGTMTIRWTWLVKFFSPFLKFECFSLIISHLLSYLNWHQWERIIVDIVSSEATIKPLKMFADDCCCVARRQLYEC